MSKQFIISALAPRHVDQAFPLVQAAHRPLTPDGWRDLAGQFLSGDAVPDLDRPPGNGIYVCATEQGILRGLFCYRVGKSGERGPLGRRLNVPFLVAIGLFDTVATVEALRETIEKLALTLRCGSVTVDLAGCRLSSLAPAIDPLDHFKGQGYRLDGDRLIRDLTSEQSFPHFARA